MLSQPETHQAFIVSLLLVTLTGCFGGSDNRDEDLRGPDDAPPKPLTLVIDNDNAAAALLQSRSALEILPRMQRNANLLVARGLNDMKECDNGDDFFIESAEEGQTTVVVFEDCADPANPFRTFDGRIDLNFSDPDVPFSHFFEYTNTINYNEQDRLEWALTGGFTIQGETDDRFDNAEIRSNNAFARETFVSGSDSTTLEFQFEKHSVYFNPLISSESIPYPNLSGNSRVVLIGPAQGRVQISTPHYLDGRNFNTPFCYDTGEMVVDGADGTRAQLDYNGTDIIVTVNGVITLSGDCEALIDELVEQAGLTR